LRLGLYLLALSAMIVLHQATHGPLWEWGDVSGLHHETYALICLAAAGLAWRVRSGGAALAALMAGAGVALSASLIAFLGAAELGVWVAAASIAASSAYASAGRWDSVRRMRAMELSAPPQVPS
jgi:hypothetical protein